MNNKETEKLYTELRVAKAEEEMAASIKRSKIEEVKKNLFTQFQELLTANAGQRFAIKIEGVFNKIEAWGVTQHKMRMTGFHHLFAGIISDNPVLHNPDTSSLVGQHSPFPAQKLIIGVMTAKLETKEPLYMQFSPRNDASWYLDDFLMALAPDDIKTIIAPRKYKKDEEYVTVTLWIGNTRFEEYLKTRDDKTKEEILTLLEQAA